MRINGPAPPPWDLGPVAEMTFNERGPACQPKEPESGWTWRSSVCKFRQKSQRFRPDQKGKFVLKPAPIFHQKEKFRSPKKNTCILEQEAYIRAILATFCGGFLGNFFIREWENESCRKDLLLRVPQCLRQPGCR
jgi:hypothetical protein